MTTFASGLKNPRGLKFGPDGNLYVAEGGTGGTDSTVGQCDQVGFPIGPYTGGFPSRISKVNAAGVVTPIAENLPSSQTSPMSGGLVSGVADVAFIGDTLYGIEAAAGCSHGLANTSNTVFRVNGDGTTTTIADFSAFQQANPVANPGGPGDFDARRYVVQHALDRQRAVCHRTESRRARPDSPQWSHLVGRRHFRAVRAHRADGLCLLPGRLLHREPEHVPVVPGSAQLMRMNVGGRIKNVLPGLTTVVGVAFDSKGRLYVLESDTVPGFPGPPAAGSGMVLRINDDQSLTTIASGLVFPTAMTFGPDGALYVSNFGFGVPAVGLGQIVRIEVGQ